MNAEERALTAVLSGVAAEATPGRVPSDLWARGRRRHRTRVAVMTLVSTVVVALVALPVLFAPSRHRALPAEQTPTIPARIIAPPPMLPNLVQSPNGPASMVLTGPGGWGASDVFGYEDRAIVVGQDGLYRWVRQRDAFDAGESLLLSPDGRYLAGDGDLEGAEPPPTWNPHSATAVMDLTTGRVRTYISGPPIAWSPDGRLLMLTSAASLTLIDPERDDGFAFDANLGTSGLVPTVAFSPDGQRLALQRGTTLVVYDRGAGHTAAELGAGARLAGPGAWTSDGRFAVWRPAGAGTYELTFVDGNGPVFSPVHVASPRLLGWQSDGDAVVVLTPPSGAPRVVALHPGGGETDLVDVYGGANRVDIARDSLDRFGGPTPPVWVRLTDLAWVQARSYAPWLSPIALVVGALFLRRRIRTGSWRKHPRFVRRAADFPRRF